VRRRGQEGLTELRGNTSPDNAVHDPTATAQEGWFYSEAKGSGSPIEKSYALDHAGKIDIPHTEGSPAMKPAER
jgi:hypothetical protein